MAFALVQNLAATGNTDNPAITLAAAPTNGNLVVACLGHFATVTDPSGYSRRSTVTGTNIIMAIVEKVAGAGESATLTFTGVQSSKTWDLEVFEFSGNLAAGSEYDASAAGATGTATSAQPGSLTPAAANELFVAATVVGGTNGGSEAIDSSFNIVDAATFTKMVVGYKIKTDSVAENPTLSWTTSGAFACAMSGFKSQVVGPVSRRLLSTGAVARAAYR